MLGHTMAKIHQTRTWSCYGTVPKGPEIRPGQHIARQLLVLGWCRRRVIRAPKTRFQVKAEYRENYFLCNRNLVNSFYFDSDTMILCHIVVTTQMATLVSLQSIPLTPPGLHVPSGSLHTRGVQDESHASMVCRCTYL